MSTPTSATTLPPALRWLAFVQITAATVLSFAATDLVLPAIPGLPQSLGGTAAQAQYVLAAFGIGLGAGLLLFGELGARHGRRGLMAAALLLLAGSSLAATQVQSVQALIALRFVQGVAAAAGPAFAPGVIRQLFSGPQAMRAIGLQGSLEALIPALAPIAGAWLLTRHGWSASFGVLGALALLAAVSLPLLPRAAFAPPVVSTESGAPGGYLRLLHHREFLRFSLSHALCLGGLLILVFGAPAVVVSALGGTLTDFIRMQIMGVASFIVAANLATRLSVRHGAVRVIVAGSALSAAGAGAIALYALAGGASPVVVSYLFIAVNLGFGLRGPPGFLQALQAGGQDDSRAAALIILFILLTAACGTVGVAPWITQGLLPLALTAAAVSAGSLAVLYALRPRNRH